VVAHKALACEQIRERVFQDIYRWIGSGKILDDITLVLVRRTA
jgi:serine phosphatase RsbU (regulator of sigma subunit)